MGIKLRGEVRKRMEKVCHKWNSMSNVGLVDSGALTLSRTASGPRRRPLPKGDAKSTNHAGNENDHSM